MTTATEDKALFTTTEAADRLRIPPVLLRWICLAEGVPRESSGRQKLLGADQVAWIEARIRAVDPGGGCRSRSGRRHRAPRRVTPQSS